MKIESGMTAYVSGGGSGIGRGISLALAARGVNVGVATSANPMPPRQPRQITASGGKAIPLAVDVSDAASVEAAADHIEGAFGPVSIVCNNAGIAMHGVPLHEIEMKDWDWAIGVNVYGVIHGISSFVPRLLDGGRPAHMVNTASIGGFQVNPNFLTGAYSMTKYAVVALSEALRNELAGTKVGVSVLAPAAVDTGIHLSERSRPERLGGAYVRPQNHFMGDLIKGSARPEEIGERVAQAIEGGDFYIFTHPETRGVARPSPGIHKGSLREGTARPAPWRRNRADHARQSRFLHHTGAPHGRSSRASAPHRRDRRNHAHRILVRDGAAARAFESAESLGTTTELIAGPLLDLPMYDPSDDHRSPSARRLVQSLRSADGIIVSSPSYHGALSGVIKNALDYAEDMRDDRPALFRRPRVGIIVTAYGAQALGTTLVGLRSIVHALRGWPTPYAAAINSQGKPFASGKPANAEVAGQLGTVARQVVQFAQMQRAERIRYAYGRDGPS